MLLLVVLGQTVSVFSVGLSTRVPRDEWLAARAAHRDRVTRWTAPRLARRARGESHAVDDFLWEYYAFRPGQFERWSPGVGVALDDVRPADALDPKVFRVQGDVAVVAPPTDDRRIRTLRSIRRLLVATANRTATHGCFGLHEWAMVYRADPDEIRHAKHPLRLGSAGVADLVDRSKLVCTHFDAFRFFTPAATPRNARPLRSDDRERWEQPGCVHATMDLYKHAHRAAPWVPSELVVDCFELARSARDVDMAASPYDLSELGIVPIRIETEEGRAEYVAAQRNLTARAKPLRERLIATFDLILVDSADGSDDA